MIKFVASDLDGTLLPPGKSLPEETFGLIEQLYRRGVVFAPASGRQLPNLKAMFAPVLDKIAIIAENGGIAWYGGETVYMNAMTSQSVKYALGIIRQTEGMYPLFSCEDCAYYESDYAPFAEVCARSYSNLKKADLDRAALSETVMKISVWDGYPPCAEHGGKILPPLIKGLRTVVSGYDWLDVSAPDCNKGAALGALLDRLKISRSESMAFGDHMNDLEMLQVCGRPYVTANAFAGLKAVFNDTVPSNADGGVIIKLKELLKEV